MEVLEWLDALSRTNLGSISGENAVQELALLEHSIWRDLTDLRALEE